MNLLMRNIGSQTKNKLSFIMKSQFWTYDEIKKYQLDKLLDILKHANGNVPYYRKLLKQKGVRVDEIRTLEDFSNIPILTKRDIQEYLSEMVTEGVDIHTLSLNSTGGSTGMPLNFYQDANYKLCADAARLRAWRYIAGTTEKDLEAVFWGAIRDVGKGLSLKKVLYSVLRERVLPLNTFDLDETLLKKYLIYYNLFRPSLVRGYASSLYYVARYIEANGIAIHKPKAVISSTEILHVRMRESIERIFGCKVFDSYGCREISQIATECEAHNGLHVVFENQYVELVGQEIVVTNLNNYAMPFIRYKVGDLASAIDYTPCSCGRYSPRIVSLVGRDNDNIELPNGKVINGEFFEFLFFGIPAVIQYQVVFKCSTGRLLIKLHLSEPSSNIEGMLKQTMIDKYNFSAVDVAYSDLFDKTPTGKLRFVYSID